MTSSLGCQAVASVYVSADVLDGSLPGAPAEAQAAALSTAQHGVTAAPVTAEAVQAAGQR